MMNENENELKALLRDISPERIPGEFVFLSFEGGLYGKHAELEPIASFQEPEGLTLVVPKLHADSHGMAYEGIFAAITLTVQSSLEAVGFTAVFAGALAAQRIPANVFAGFNHDHVFVPFERADEAMLVLRGLGE